MFSCLNLKTWIPRRFAPRYDNARRRMTSEMGLSAG
jgi:hypothetical protein